MDLEQRVAKLERSNRRLMVLLVVAVCLGSGLGAMAAVENEGDKVFGKVTAESFEVVSPDGYALAVLAASKRSDNSQHPQGMLILAGLNDDGTEQNISFYHPSSDPKHRTKAVDK